MRFLLSAIAIMLVLTSCRPETAQAGPDPLQLMGRAWAAQEIDGKPITMERPPAIVFTANGRLSGFTGCNRMSGSVSLTKGDLKIGENLAATRMACAEPERMEMEHTFTQTLPRASKWEVRDGALLFLDAGGKTLIRFTEDKSEDSQAAE